MGTHCGASRRWFVPRLVGTSQPAVFVVWIYAGGSDGACRQIMSAKKMASEGRLPERLSTSVPARPENVELWSCLRSPSNPPVAVSPAIYFSPASIGSSASSAARHCLLHRRCLVRQFECRVPQQNLGRSVRSKSKLGTVCGLREAQTAAVHPWNRFLRSGFTCQAPA
jgi:hypothetical protein